MHLNGKKYSQHMEPKVLEIQFDSRAELDEFYALFNISAVCNALQYVNGEHIRIALGDMVDDELDFEEEHHTRIQNTIANELP